MRPSPPRRLTLSAGGAAWWHAVYRGRAAGQMRSRGYCARWPRRKLPTAAGTQQAEAEATKPTARNDVRTMCHTDGLVGRLAPVSPPPHRLHLQAVQLLAQVLLAMQGVDGAAEQSRAVAESTIAPALALNMDDVAARSMLLTAAALSVLVNESRDPEARRVRATQARRLLDDALPGTRKKLGCQARRRGGGQFFFRLSLNFRKFKIFGLIPKM